ncbi:MAG: hypothetical protein QM723_07715 [Myxococcaceae bacterium]
MGLFDLFRGGPSDPERLGVVFRDLESIGIMCRLYPESGRSEAHLFIAQELAEADHLGTPFKGFCFADSHSFGALQEGALIFSFGAATPPLTYRALWAQQVQVGKQVATALSAAKFKVAWDGSASSVIAITGLRWNLPKGSTAIHLGPKLKLGRDPKKADGVKVTSVFVGGPSPGTAAHRFLAKVAALKGSSMFGPEDGTEMAAVDFEDEGVVFDLVAGANNAPLPPAAYLLRTRDLAAECPLMIEVVEKAEAPHAAFWGDFDQSKRVRVVLGSAPDDSVADALRAIKERARA